MGVGPSSTGSRIPLELQRERALTREHQRRLMEGYDAFLRMQAWRLREELTVRFEAYQAMLAEETDTYLRRDLELTEIRK